jgi:uncharacterized membrane protein YfcA
LPTVIVAIFSHRRPIVNCKASSKPIDCGFRGFGADNYKTLQKGWIALDIDLAGWIVVALCAMMVGITKTGIPGLGILVVPMMAHVLPARKSTGILLGILILADLFAIIYHRRNAKWSHVIRLLPAAFAGIVAGFYALKRVDDQQLRPIVGVIVLVMFAATLGFIAGVTTMMANAAGPIMIIYLLAMRLPKIEFVGTGAWFFFVVNWLKVPLSAKLELMTVASVKLNLMMLPFIAVGAAAGIFLLKRIPQKAFSTVVQVLAVAAAVKLLF